MRDKDVLELLREEHKKEVAIANAFRKCKDCTLSEKGCSKDNEGNCPTWIHGEGTPPDCKKCPTCKKLMWNQGNLTPDRLFEVWFCNKCDEYIKMPVGD